MDKSEEQLPESKAKVKTPISPKAVGILIGVGVSLAGVLVAYFLVGPRIIRAQADGIIAEAVGQAIECAVVPHEEAAAAHGPAVVHEIGNLIANPAGEGGYLLVSVGLEVASDSDVEKLVALDVALRDALLRLLGSKSSADLSAPGSRELLAAEVLEITAHTAPGVKVARVLFPQFVLQ